LREGIPVEMTITGKVGGEGLYRDGTLLEARYSYRSIALLTKIKIR